MDLKLRAFGTHAFEMALSNPADRSDELKPILNVIGGRMLRSEKRLFETSGASGGQPWEPLEKETIARKKRDHSGHIRKPLWNTGREMRSLSQRNAPGSIYRVTRLYVLIGSTEPGVPFQASGTRNMEARPPIQFTAFQAAEWTGLISDFIFEGALPNS